MSANDCCGMFLSCCMCFSVCTHDSDSSCIRFCVNLFPSKWCGKLDDTYTQDARKAENAHEADLFHQNSQPASTPAMDAKGGHIRDKSLILCRRVSEYYCKLLLFTILSADL
ncbi:hypothetical protein B0H10DRAFT_696324 [Mycena sp. CBHHK59/15]|nr:hypothetical protein B0H10DRAFT_696324 [Mycena sp. CBHHK59/15]